MTDALEVNAGETVRVKEGDGRPFLAMVKHVDGTVLQCRVKSGTLSGTLRPVLIENVVEVIKPSEW